MFHQDNAPSYTLAIAMMKIHELRFELLGHPLYSPDLAPSNFFLFSHLNIALGGQGFSSNEEAITFVNNYFAEKNAEYYLDGLYRWEHRWEKSETFQTTLVFFYYIGTWTRGENLLQKCADPNLASFKVENET
ncbi:histone-lysine N-methyltransferase SETMAR [Trichonephila clavipes]|nr:histone-lysine N-methyltransferase SETMAR [Trichonephila clavipes]